MIPKILGFVNYSRNNIPLRYVKRGKLSPPPNSLLP